MDLREKDESNACRHPWELSRCEMMLSTIMSEISSSPKSIADIGSGDGFFIKNLASKIPGGTLYAVDTNYENEFEQDQNILKVKDLSQIKGEVDSLIMMDVLEHVEDDKAFLKEVTKKLNAKGMIFITVPAYQFLYSPHDKFLGHYRRYNQKMLKDLVLHPELNLEIKTTFYFYTSLFKVRFLQKLLGVKVSEEGIGGWKYSENHFVTKIFRKILNIDFMINRILKCFPGLSLCLICQKRK